ncbi:MAG: hypothetical protein RL661_358, partial [Pseudomonadota bacterium]
ITSRQMARAKTTAQKIKDQFDVDVVPIQAFSSSDRAVAIESAEVVVAAGATGIELLRAEHWQENKILQMIADANATPPLGIGGVEMMDRGLDRAGKKSWGAIGFGTLKLALHRACIARLFESNRLVLDAEEIFEIAKTMA